MPGRDMTSADASASTSSSVTSKKKGTPGGAVAKNGEIGLNQTAKSELLEVTVIPVDAEPYP